MNPLKCVLLAVLFNVTAFAHAAPDCSEAILAKMQASKQFQGSLLKVAGTQSLKPHEDVFIRADDFGTHQDITTQVVFIEEYQMAVLMNIFAVLADPATCNPLESIRASVTND